MSLLYSFHFKNAICLTVFSIATVVAISIINQECMKKNKGNMSNDFLLGTWYKIYKFTNLGRYYTCACPHVTFSKPTIKELFDYANKVSLVQLPQKIDDTAIILDRIVLKGLLLGEKEVKTFIIEPSSPVRVPDHYEMYVYRRINNQYILFWHCKDRDQAVWLLTRDPRSPETEMQRIAKERPEIIYKDKGFRFCNGTCI